MRTLTSWVDGLAALLLPSICIACRQLTDEDAPLCPACALGLEPIARACPRCGLPAPDSVPDEERGSTPAASCLGCAREPPPWRRARAPFVFGGPLATAIRRWKMGPVPELSRPLARLLAPALAALSPDVDALVPVPLHPRRLRQREFNQAALLARGARAWRGAIAPPVLDLLERVRDTPPQSALDAAARRRNVRGAFRLRPRRGIPPHLDRRGPELADARLCLVDDVLTTGATARACALALLDAGAASVDVLTLARALP